MKKQYRGTFLGKATPKGYSIWIGKEQFETMDAMPDEETTPPPKGGGGSV